MAFGDELLARRLECELGHAASGHASDVRAGYGECTLCSCPSFVGGQNDVDCGNCRHSKSVHRY